MRKVALVCVALLAAAAPTTAAAAGTPSAPRAPTAGPGNARATVSWTAPADDGGAPVDAYRVTPFRNGVAQPVVTFGSAATTRTVTGLTNGATYTFRVAAHNSAGWGPNSSATAAIVVGAPTRPRGPLAAPGSGRATVYWRPPAAANASAVDAYRVWPYVDGVAQAPRTFASTATSQVVTGLTNGTTYTFRVAAHNALGWSPRSLATTGVKAGAATPSLAAADVALSPVVSGLDQPTAVAFRPGDQRIFVAEQSGRVRMVRDGQVVGTALTLDVSTGGEQGLLGLDFSADGSKMYVDYTDPAGDTRVDEYQMSGGVANVATRRELLFVDQPFANHNGGQVTRGPDGKLYVAFGDGGSGGDPLDNGQDLTTLLGKIVRIDPTPAGGSPYTVPDDNPFVGQAGVDEAIWMYGLRNPWRFSFDRAAGDVWIGDVGQNAYEEVDFVVSAQRNAGVNWGWSLREGRHQFKGPKPPGARDPIVELPHADGDCAVTGGYVYRGASIANLGGAYVYADFCVGALRAEVQQGGRIVQSRYLGPQVSQVTTFGQGRLGELYVASRTGTLYKLVPG